MTKRVDARYRSGELPEYNGHPLITALPPILPDDAVNRMYSTTWASRSDERNAPAHLRRKMVKRLKQFVFPLPEYVDVFRVIEDAIITGYLPKNPTTPTGQHFLHYLDASDTSTKPISGAFCPAGSALSLFGESGAGKTCGVTQTLEQYPQVITHKEFAGRSLPLTQVTWLSVECPAAASVSGFATAVLDQLSKALGSNQLERFPKPKNVHEAGIYIQRRLRSLWLGILILEELQNLSVGKAELRAQFLNLVLTIINEAGVPVLFCGNHETKSLLQDTLRNARRAEDAGQIDMGPIDPRIWPMFAQELWPIQYTDTATSLDDTLSNKLYYLSRGLPAFAVKIYMKAQECVIGTGEETITSEVLDEAYLVACSLSAAQLEDVPLPDTASVEDITPDVGVTENTDTTNAVESPTKAKNEPTVADIDKVQHPEFKGLAINTRNNGFRVPIGIDTDVLRSALDQTDPYLSLLSKNQLLTDLYTSDSLM